MRDYLYLWHQPRLGRLVASGIEFRDLIPELLPAGGLVLLRHQFGEASLDAASRLEFVPADRLRQLAADNIHGYGDFCWTDIAGAAVLGDLSDCAIAELTFFAHMARPLAGVEIPGLGNRFLYWAHDDGWYARIFYHRWDAVGSTIQRHLTGLLGEERALGTLDLVRHGGAFWCHANTVIPCEQTEDIDALQQKHMPSLRTRASMPPRAAP